MPYLQPSGGWIELICGSMFSGKTEELIRRVRRAEIAKQKVQVFKPASTCAIHLKVASHTGFAAELGQTGGHPAELRPDTNVVAIDEAQFFDGRR